METTYIIKNHGEVMPLRAVLENTQRDREDIESRYVKIDIREHRHYKFQKDLNFDWDLYDEFQSNERLTQMYGQPCDKEESDDLKKRYDEMMKELDENYWWRFIDCYDHSAITFSIAGTGIQCRFDTKNNAGIVAVPKALNDYDLEEWNKSQYKDKGSKIIKTEEQAYKDANRTIQEYSEWCNGGGPFSLRREQQKTYRSDDGDEIKIWDFIDEDYNYFCGYYYSMDKDSYEEEIIDVSKKILKDLKGIDCNNITIEQSFNS